MNDHFIKNIEIKNFKCFQNFKAEGFGRVNLIGGKNNVGKTAFMEASYINLHSQDIKSCLFSLLAIKKMRNILNLCLDDNVSLTQLLESNNNISIDSNLNDIAYTIHENDGIKKYHFKFMKQVINVNANEFSSEAKAVKNIKFIDNFGFNNTQLNEVFEVVQKKDKEEILYKYIQQFDPNILNFKIIGGNRPQSKTRDGDYRDLYEFGDGLKHYISIICTLYACENGQLFIDEIDNGIHYTQLENMWELILNISKEVNCQVFATTHSKECIESFNRVQKELEDKETYYFEMYKNIKDNKIEMRSLEDEQLAYELSHEGRLRGE